MRRNKEQQYRMKVRQDEEVWEATRGSRFGVAEPTQVWSVSVACKLIGHDLKGAGAACWWMDGIDTLQGPQEA